MKYDRALPFGTSAMMDIVSLVCLHWARAMRDEPSPAIIADSLEGWSEAAACFLRHDHLSRDERLAARVQAVELFGRLLLEQEARETAQEVRPEPILAGGTTTGGTV